MAEKDFPWRRIVWAETLDRLFAAGARVVAFDIVFGSKNVDDPEFAAAIARHRDRIVLAMTTQDLSEEAGKRLKQLIYPNESLLADGPANLVASSIVHPDAMDDSVIRQADHFTSELRELGEPDTSNEIPGLAALAVAKFTGHPPDAGQHHLVRYQGPRQTYLYRPIEGLFDSRMYGEPLFQNGAVFRDKIVFIGATFELAHDDKATPFGQMAGVEFHAQLAGDLLSGARLRNISPQIGWWLMTLTTLAPVGLITWLKRAWLQALSLLGLLLGYVAVSYWAFASRDVALPMMAPLIGATTIGALGILLSFVLEQWEKAQTRRVLERSINKRIAEVVLQNAEFEHARLGERRTVTILFSDIRGFTSLAEQIQPEHLVGQLNEYFERMVDIIEREQSLGNAHAFIGDAILAAWGDTPKNSFGDAEDARRAVTAALRMRAELKNLNTIWDARPDRSVIKIGIGVNVGNVVVGQVGHPERQSYTMLGDGVNFAARLETGTKQFHTDILVGESVEALTRKDFVYRHADFVCVKGKTKPVNVFIPLSDKNTPPPEWLEDYHRARQLFLERKFLEAGDLFRALPARIGGEDFLCSLYRDLCDRYSLTPPPESWNGSRELTEK